MQNKYKKILNKSLNQGNNNCISRLSFKYAPYTKYKLAYWTLSPENTISDRPL